MKIFTVFDAKAEAYLQPFYARTNGEAIRSFAEACSNPEHNFCKYGADFTLFDIGEFDENTGVITPCVPHALGNGLDLKINQ